MELLKLGSWQIIYQMKSTFMTNGNLMVAPYSLQRQSGLKGGIVWPFHAEQLGVPAILHYGPQKRIKKLQKIIGNIINDWLIAEKQFEFKKIYQTIFFTSFKIIMTHCTLP